MSASAESDTTNTPSPNSRSVQLKTFLRWNTGGQIGVKTDTNGHLTSVWCKLCAKHCEQVIKDTKIRGQAKSDVQKYICGTDFITKHNVMRHLGSAAHKTAIEYEKLCSGTDKIIDLDLDDDTDSNNSKPHFEIPLRQPTITKSFQDMSNDAYRKLLDAAYTLAVDGLPFSHFKTLVQVMKNCGARLISKYDNSNRAREFVNFLADAVREKITNVLNSVTCFSLLTDGSQARKTGSEKELAFIKVIHDGNPTFLCAALCNIDEY
ncbi:hypothetical protein SNE40_018194 [Patella caerulea]|uniref:Uncharacterized protein n=1 Tax=Patella caerulea TaxID=87958 RepID=A0AAN8PGR1_PATCE